MKRQLPGFQFALVVTLCLAGCSSPTATQAPPTEAPKATATSPPTSEPTSTATPTATREPTLTPTFTPTFTPTPVLPVMGGTPLPFTPPAIEAGNTPPLLEDPESKRIRDLVDLARSLENDHINQKTTKKTG